jgi:hypothetical protein
MAVRLRIHVRMQFRIADEHVVAAENTLEDALARLPHGNFLPIVEGDRARLLVVALFAHARLRSIRDLAAAAGP